MSQESRLDLPRWSFVCGERPTGCGTSSLCGSLDHPLGSLLAAAVRASFNIVISGPAGSGRTTLLDALTACIPPDQRPGRAVVGDVHRAELRRLLHAMARGPGGALAVVRATSPDGALPALAALSGAATTRSAETTAGHAVDLIVHLEHAANGTRQWTRSPSHSSAAATAASPPSPASNPPPAPPAITPAAASATTPSQPPWSTA